jgi:hypothetical protein
MFDLKEQYVINKKGLPTGVIITKKNYDKLLKYINKLESITAHNKPKKEKMRIKTHKAHSKH